MSRRSTFFRTKLTLKEGYRRLCSWVPPFKSPKFIKQLSFELYKWAHRKDALFLPQFLKLHAIHPRVFNAWLDEHPELEYVHEMAISLIGCNREHGALHFRLSAAFVMKSQSYYSGEWKEAEKWHADLKNGVEKVAEQPQVYIQAIRAHIPVVDIIPAVSIVVHQEIALNAPVINKPIEIDHRNSEAHKRPVPISHNNISSNRYDFVYQNLLTSSMGITLPVNTTTSH
jgi:hypothetical protein